MASHWKYCTLEQLTSFVIGGDWGKDLSQSDPELVETYCIRGSELRNWREEKGRTAALRKVSKSSLEKRKLEEGDILVEISGGGPEQPVGRTVIIDKEVLAFEPSTPKVCTNFFRLVRLKDDVNKKFVNYFLHHIYISGQVVEYQGGSNNLRNLRFPDYSKLSIPLPPLPEQKLIVAKLDTLFAHLDQLRSRLDKIPVLLKQFRQAVLTQAVTGKLTEEWRNEHDIRDDNTEALLRRIHSQRINTYQNDLQLSKRRKSSKGRLLQDTNFSPLVITDDKLPMSWKRTRIRDVVDCLDYMRRPVNKEERSTRQGDIPYYGANGRVDWINDYLFDEDLVVVVEDETFIGRELPFSYIIRGKSWVNNHAHVLRPLGAVSVEYLNLSLAHYNFIPLTAGTTGRRKLTQKSLLDAVFPVAPLEEQKEIVHRVRFLFSMAGAIEERAELLRTQVDRLPRTILSKAFRAELVKDPIGKELKAYSQQADGLLMAAEPKP